VSGLTLSGPSATNYSLAALTGLTADITPATLMVSAVNKSRTFGLPNPTLTASFSGFIGAEGTNVLTGAPTLSTGATTNNTPGVYPITISAGTLNAANYTFAFNNGTLTVVATPWLSGVLLSSNKVVFSYPTIVGQTYQLLYKTNLTAAAWIPLGSYVIGTGTSVLVTNIPSTSLQHYFKLGISQ